MLKADPCLNPVRRYFPVITRDRERWDAWGVNEAFQDSWLQLPRAANGGDLRLLKRRAHGPEADKHPQDFSGKDGTDGMHGRDGRSAGSLLIELRSSGS